MNSMENFNLDELMDLSEAYVGLMIDAIYRRLMDRDFAMEDPEVFMLLTVLINILGHDNRGDRPTEVLLMAAYGERGVLDCPNMRVMRWRNGALSGSDLANEPGLGSSRTYQPGEMPMPSKPKPGLTRMHQEMSSEAASSGSPLRAAVPPKRAKVEQRVQTNQTIQELEGKYDVIISAPNRMIEMENLRPLRAELPAVWSDISNAMRGFKDHALHMLVLDEVLGLELSNFSRQLKLKPGIDDDHRVVTAMSNDLWFRAMEITGEKARRKNSQETRAHLEAMVLRTKPEANQWLHLSPRVATLGADAFDQGPIMMKKIRAYLLKEVNLAENAEEKTAEFVIRMSQITLETFWTQEVKGEEGFERTDSMLEGLGAGWTASFLAKVYPKISHYLIKEFLQEVVEISIVELLALFVMFGAENFVKGPAVLLTEGVQNLRLDGFLTLIAITHGNLGGLMKLTRCPEQMKERVRTLDMKKATDSWNKIRDLRHTLI